MHRRRARWLLPLLLVGPTSLAAGDDLVTYADHIRPIFAARCLNCHNPDKLKGDLDLSTFSGTMTGGSGGAVVAAGDADGSALVGVVSHTREPKMPPKGDRLGDQEIALIRAWVAGGCRETASSAAAPSKPKISLGGSAARSGPREALRLPMDARPPLDRAPSVVAMASLDHAPILALAARREVLLVDLDLGAAIGALPTDDDAIHSLRFARDGSLLVAGGGIDGKSGRVWLWSLPEGRLLTHVGEEVDVVLAADVDTARERVALGGPQKVVKILSVADNTIVERLRKHTDWITAIAYSPDGVLLATADRAGGVQVWEAESLAPYQTLAGHTARVTALDWSADSNVLVSASEDGRVRLWSMQAGPDGAVAKEWVADPSGVLSMRVTSDNHVVTGGRDRTVKAWDAAGTLLRTYPALADVATAVAACEGGDGAAIAVVGADLVGGVGVWSATEGKPLAAFPNGISTGLPPVEERLARVTAGRDASIATREERAAASVVAERAKAAAVEALAAATRRGEELTAAATAAHGARDAALAASAAAAQAAGEAEATVASASKTVDEANVAVGAALAALGSDVERDRAAQAALASAESAQREAESAAGEAERTAAANDDPATRSAAEAKRSAAQSAQAGAAAAKSAAEASSATLRQRLAEVDQAKVRAAAAGSALAAAKSGASSARDAAAAAKAAADGATGRAAEADVAVTNQHALIAERTAEVTAAGEALSRAGSTLAEATRDVQRAERLVALHQAGVVRHEIDAVRGQLDRAIAAALPATSALATAEAEAAQVEAAWKEAEAAMVGAASRREALIGERDRRATALTVEEAGLAGATARATERARELASVAELAAAIATSAAARPEATSLVAARDRLAEAKSALEGAVRDAAGEVTAATERSIAAKQALELAASDLAAFEREETLLPTRVDALRATRDEAAARVGPARAAAEAALAPATPLQARLAQLDAEYARLQRAAAPTTP